MRPEKSETGAMPESTMATPIPFPVGSESVSPSCVRNSLAFFTTVFVTLLVSDASGESGDAASGASIEIDETPGSASSDFRALEGTVTAMTLTRGDVWPTLKPALCRADSTEPQLLLWSTVMLLSLIHI